MHARSPRRRNQTIAKRKQGIAAPSVLRFVQQFAVGSAFGLSSQFELAVGSPLAVELAVCRSQPSPLAV